jgi:signal transduction histidine kinase
VRSDPVKILLIDDEPRNLDVLESLLRSPDHELVRALSADQALMLLLDGDFAVIVLDIQMPGMSGLELAAAIKRRKRTRHIPIIFLTAYFQDDQDVLEGYGSGAVDYLTKPINPQILRSKIAVFVDLFRKTRALAATNAALELEIGQRLKAEAALREANAELEARVGSRTAALTCANEELRASEARFKAASHAKDDFLAALSHELRTPLNPVLLLASDAAADPALTEEVRGRFASIRTSIELEARLIDDLLDLTRITRGILRLEMQPVDAHAVLSAAVAIVRPEAEAKNVGLTVDLAAGERQLHGDGIRLQQVFWNLLKNAVKFTPAGGKIALATSASADRAEWALTISDTGIGLTPDERTRIFEAFVQGEHSRGADGHRFGGLGLGLAISRTLVEMHAGRIEAASGGRGLGSVFTVTLPLRRAKGAGDGDPAPAKRAPPAPSRASGCRPLRILLVEDHAPTRVTLAQLLRGRDHEVVAADSAAEARAAAGPFDLIISDLGLPDGGGWELLESLREVQPDLPGIALSGYGTEQDIARSRRSGFVEHMIKPVAIEALEAAISSVVANGAGRRDARAT